jgi:hypothetical protein
VSWYETVWFAEGLDVDEAIWKKDGPGHGALPVP